MPEEGGMGLPHQFGPDVGQKGRGKNGAVIEKMESVFLAVAECTCVCVYWVLALGTQLSSG